MPTNLRLLGNLHHAMLSFALSVILNMTMHKQGKKTLSMELWTDCQQVLQEMEIQFENKWSYQKC